jgi:two-component system heavy metal sensor histidine kinase CusS
MTLNLGFRTRIVVAATALTLLTLSAAFAVISIVVTRGQERHLDEALLHAARDEVADASRLHRDALTLGDRPALDVNEIGTLLTKYAAIYDETGRVRSATPAFGAERPPRAVLNHPVGSCFDLALGRTTVRAVLSAIPNHPGTLLLMAAPRAAVDADAAFLRKAMGLVFAVAVAWTVVVAIFIARRLSRAQRRMARAVREVAAGNLRARVGVAQTGGDEAQLARDIDDMIERLSELLDAQRVFIAHAAHELRSPLTVLYGELALALRRSRDAGEYRRAIETAFVSTHELKDLAEDLLAVARLGSAPPPEAVACDAAEALIEARRIVDPGEGPGRVGIVTVGACGPVRGTHRDLVRLLRNLLENAVRHSPVGGTVTCELGERGAFAVVTIADEGPGVPVPARDKIFAPFYRGPELAAPRLHGAESGLGLTIARGIARAYGGDVVLDEGFRRGARFEITLPFAPVAQEREAEPSASLSWS